MSVKVINEADFYSVVAERNSSTKEWLPIHDKPVIVDFFADWCQPCKALSPILDELAVEYSDSITIYKVNIDKDEDLTNLFNIKMVPTLLFAKPDSDKPTLMLGVMSKEELRSKVKELLLK